MKEFIQKMSTI